MKDRKPIRLTLLLAQPRPHTRELPSGRIVPGFGSPGTTLACSRACKAQRCRATLSLAHSHWIITEKTKANPNFSAIIKQRGGIHYLAAVNI